MQKYDDMKSEISVRTGPEDKFRKKTNTLFFLSTFMSSMNWSAVVEVFSPTQSPVAFFLRNNVELSL